MSPTTASSAKLPLSLEFFPAKTPDGVAVRADEHRLDEAGFGRGKGHGWGHFK